MATVQLRLAPQAGVHRVGCGGIVGDERVARDVPHHAAGRGVGDTSLGYRGDEAAINAQEVVGVEVELNGCIRGAGVWGCWLSHSRIPF